MIELEIEHAEKKSGRSSPPPSHSSRASRPTPLFRADVIRALRDVYSIAVRMCVNFTPFAFVSNWLSSRLSVAKRESSEWTSENVLWWASRDLWAHIVRAIREDVSFPHFWMDYGKFVVERMLFWPYLYRVDVKDYEGKII